MRAVSVDYLNCVPEDSVRVCLTGGHRHEHHKHPNTFETPTSSVADHCEEVVRSSKS